MPRWVFPGTRRHLPERWKAGKRHPYPWQAGCICCSIFRQPFRLQISLRYVNRLICPISRWHIHFLWNCRNCLLYRMNRWHPTELCDSDEEISSFTLWCWERAGQIRRRWLSRICFGDARKKNSAPWILPKGKNQVSKSGNRRHKAAEKDDISYCFPFLGYFYDSGKSLGCQGPEKITQRLWKNYKNLQKTVDLIFFCGILYLKKNRGKKKWSGQ